MVKAAALDVSGPELTALRARETASSRRAAIAARPSVSALWITGTIRPSSTATARPTLISA